MRATDPRLEGQARELLREYLISQSANVERAERLAEKASRLEEAGTPSESARNRADRAGREVAAGVDALRARFAHATRGGGETEQSLRAFDRAWHALLPEFAPPARPGEEG